MRSIADGVVVAVPDALAAKASVDVLYSASIDALCLSGLLSRSPLSMREATKATGLAVLTPEQLARGELAPLLGQRASQST